MRTRLRRTGPIPPNRKTVACTTEMAREWCADQGLDPDEMLDDTIEHHSVLKTFRIPRYRAMVGHAMTALED